MPRPVDPSKIIAFTTMKNFRPRPNAVMAANLLAEEDRDPSYYEKNPWQPLARAIGIQRYDTALMIMRTAAVLPDEVKEQYDRLAAIQKEMGNLYRIWYQDGGLFSAKNLSNMDMEYVDISFHDYKEVAKAVVRISRLFRRKNKDQEAISYALRLLGDSADRIMQEIKKFYTCKGLL